ncbi:hypothetical protein BB561_005341 [Smittium simulii]|uniref:Endonuclease/exonuclease/phosphatase domain-containing protein n=1 Tax=Smittium simulii TaxID=133385 RepID=A0A2T9YAW2_9FUNG|nr:hypothetical protein BB561_005341 [Smittium simulii]
MSNVPSVVPSATNVPFLPSAKRTRVDYSTEKYTGLIDPVTKKDINFDLRTKNNTKNQKLKQMCVGGSDSWMSVKINSKAASGKENEITGDFNMDTKSTINWVNKIGVGLTRMPVFNSRGSRLNGIKMGRMIDHICSVNLDFQFIGASVIKNVDISDHFPVNSVWINSEKTLDAEKTKKIDRELITLKSDKIINHNYYAVLSEHIESTSDTDIIEKKSLAVWVNHFSGLAQTTSIRNKNFELFSLSKINVFTLKPTPNNKAAGIDAIPSQL